MRRKMTIVVEDAVYQGLQEKVGPGQISNFIEDLVRPHVVGDEPDDGWRIPPDADARPEPADDIRAQDHRAFIARAVEESLD